VTLFDVQSEARLLLAMIAEEGVMDCCDRVDLDHFADPRHVAILTAIRELQDNGEPVTLSSVGDAISMRDLEHDSHVADSAGHGYLVRLFVEMPLYRSGVLIFHDIGWLHTLGQRRRALT
jgi:replicative DNA helicase